MFFAQWGLQRSREESVPSDRTRCPFHITCHVVSAWPSSDSAFGQRMAHRRHTGGRSPHSTVHADEICRSGRADDSSCAVTCLYRRWLQVTRCPVQSWRGLDCVTCGMSHEVFRFDRAQPSILVRFWLDSGGRFVPAQLQRRRRSTAADKDLCARKTRYSVGAGTNLPISTRP